MGGKLHKYPFFKLKETFKVKNRENGKVIIKKSKESSVQINSPNLLETFWLLGNCSSKVVGSWENWLLPPQSEKNQKLVFYGLTGQGEGYGKF